MKSAMPTISSRRNHGTSGVRRIIGGDGDDGGIPRRHRLAAGANLDLAMGFALVAFDQDEVGRRQAGQHLCQRRLLLLAHDGVAMATHDRHLGGTGGTMPVRIPARMIDIEIVMAVLDRVDGEPAAHELGDQPLHQGRLAGILPAGDAEDTLLAHGEIRSALA